MYLYLKFIYSYVIMLHTTQFFNTLLGLSSPFSVATVEYQEAEDSQKSIHIHVGVDTSSTFRPFPDSTIHDYQVRTWQIKAVI